MGIVFKSLLGPFVETLVLISSLLVTFSPLLLLHSPVKIDIKSEVEIRRVAAIKIFILR